MPNTATDLSPSLPITMTPAHHLRSCLIAALAIEPNESFDKELARSAIVGSDLDMIICAKPHDWPQGKACMFGRLFAWVYGETLAGKALRVKK